MRAEAAAGRKAGMAAVIVAVAGFGVFLGLLPRLQGPGGNAVQSDSAVPEAIPAAQRVTDSPPSSTPAVATSMPSPAAAASGGLVVPPPTESPFRIDPPPGEDARIDFTAELAAGSDPKEAAVLRDGDELAWTFRVANAGTEFLWGVYVYLELHGPVRCGTTRLAPGESTTCAALVPAYAGTQTAWAWVTAWTQTAMIATDLRHTYVVAP